jgi:2-polyprenyl-3-methyl-5-hydroxy-6-metoxy-1,4-benzoquinol methylase
MSYNGNKTLVYGDMFHCDKYVRKRFGVYKDFLSPYLSKGVRILDVGGYTGDLLLILPQRVNYTVVDFDKEALKIARGRGARVVCLDIETESLPMREKFDIVVATEIFEHLKDPEKLLIQIKKSLKKNGILLASLPNECTLYHRIKVLLGLGIDGTAFAPYYHLHFPTLSQSETFLSRYFKILKKKYWFHKDPGGRLGRLFSLFPDFVIASLTNFSPNLFARGVIYLGKNEKDI